MPKTKVYYPTTITVRLAPVQLAVIKYCVDKFPLEMNNPDGFKDTSDFIRRAVTLQSKQLLDSKEFELACNLGYKEMKTE